MLSRIENGFALPSLQTLLYLSEKLGVPAGYLLAEEDEEFKFKKITEMPDIMQSFKDGNWQICIDLCSKLGGTDDEIAHIVSLCRYNEALEAFESGELKAAAQMFDDAKSISENTFYASESISSVCDAYLYCIGTISPLLVSDIDVVRLPSAAALSNEFCRYFISLKSVELPSMVQIDHSNIINQDTDGNVFYKHICARFKMKNGYHNEAYHIMKEILASDSKIPAPMLYFIFADLELCCRELSDYRGAYEYSSDKTGMLEKFLG
jgi:transcriptional regulator with XRE-family HTH domain